MKTPAGESVKDKKPTQAPAAKQQRTAQSLQHFIYSVGGSPRAPAHPVTKIVRVGAAWLI